jgi:hypothetical protein
VASDLLECVKADENFLTNIITGNETSLHVYDTETKQQSSQYIVNSCRSRSLASDEFTVTVCVPSFS